MIAICRSRQVQNPAYRFVVSFFCTDWRGSGLRGAKGVLGVESGGAVTVLLSVGKYNGGDIH